MVRKLNTPRPGKPKKGGHKKPVKIRKLGGSIPPNAGVVIEQGQIAKPPLLTIEQRMGKAPKPFRIADARAQVEAYEDNRPEGQARKGLTPTPEGTQAAVVERMEERKVMFLETLVQLDISFGTIFHTCEYLKSRGIIGISTRRVYAWRESDEEFDKAVKQVLLDIEDQVNAEAVRRGVRGVTKPVFGSLGQDAGTGIVGYIQEYSDPLLIDIRKSVRSGKEGHGGKRKSDQTPANVSPFGSELTDTQRVAELNALVESIRVRLAGSHTDSTHEMESDQ